MSRYMTILVLAGAAPLILSFWPPLGIWRNAKALAGAILVVVVVFGGWDIFSVWSGQWSFTPDAVWKARLINLPVEEVLFFVIIPFCCIFTWEAVKYLLRNAR